MFRFESLGFTPGLLEYVPPPSQVSTAQIVAEEASYLSKSESVANCNMYFCFCFVVRMTIFFKPNETDVPKQSLIGRKQESSKESLLSRSSTNGDDSVSTMSADDELANTYRRSMHRLSAIQAGTFGRAVDDDDEEDAEEADDDDDDDNDDDDRIGVVRNHIRLNDDDDDDDNNDDDDDDDAEVGAFDLGDAAAAAIASHDNSLRARLVQALVRQLQ